MAPWPCFPGPWTPGGQKRGRQPRPSYSLEASWLPGSSERSLWSGSESNPPWADPPGGSLPGCPSKELALECNSSPAQALLSYPGGPCWSLGPRGTPCWGTARKEVAKGAGSPRGQAYDHRHQTPDKGQSSFLRSSSPVWPEWQPQDLWSPQRKAKAPMFPPRPKHTHRDLLGRKFSAWEEGISICRWACPVSQRGRLSAHAPGELPPDRAMVYVHVYSEISA